MEQNKNWSRNTNRQKRMKKASSPVKHNNQLKDGDGREKHTRNKKRQKNPVGLKNRAKNEIGRSYHYRQK